VDRRHRERGDCARLCAAPGAGDESHLLRLQRRNALEQAPRRLLVPDLLARRLSDGRPNNPADGAVTRKRLYSSYNYWYGFAAKSCVDTLGNTFAVHSGMLCLWAHGLIWYLVGNLCDSEFPTWESLITLSRYKKCTGGEQKTFKITGEIRSEMDGFVIETKLALGPKDVFCRVGAG
jgi:hypothetical protein